MNPVTDLISRIIVVIVTAGALFYAGTAAHDLHGAVIENRQIGCVNRYLNGEKYDHACDQYVLEYQRKNGQPPK